MGEVVRVSELDEVMTQLNEVNARLDALPADAYGERVELRDRQRDLRAQLGRLREELPRDRTSLLQELKQLDRQLDRVIEDRGVVAASGAGGGPGGDSGSVAFFDRMARQVDEAMGREQIQARMREIRRLLRADRQRQRGEEG